MSRILSVTTIAALCAAVSGATHAQTAATADQCSISHAAITEYLTPTQQSLPQALDIDAKGNVWYVETAAGKIAVLRPDQTTSEYTVPNGGQPFTPKVASDGIWFTDSANHAIGNLNPST